MAQTEIKVRLPKPHAQQLLFRDSKAKRKVVCAGRRGGKTTGMAILAVEALLKGRRVLEAAPVADQTDAFWAACCAALAEPIAAGLVRKNETNRILELRGGRIRAKTAYDANTLRGDYADLLILDEYSLMDKSAWEEVGAPMLLDNDGDAAFIFTPRSFNHAHTLYQKAISDETGRWQAFHFRSMDNPYLSPAALAEITKDMSEAAYKQEILAEFLSSDGAVFRNVDACLTAPQTTPAEHRGHLVVAGVDWGRSHDYSAHSGFCVDCRAEVYLDRFNLVAWKLQQGRLLAALELWGVRYARVETNSIGSPNLESMRELSPRGLTLTGFETTSKSKGPLIQALALCFEKQSAKWLPDSNARHELIAYEAEVMPSGYTRYSAPENGFDDTVIARCLAWKAAKPYLNIAPSAEPETARTGEIGGMVDGFGLDNPTMRPKPLNAWDIQVRRGQMEEGENW